MSNDEASTEAFEKARPRLWGLAYRMLGSTADADDAVQDTWLRWQTASSEDIASPDAWLTTACSRRCIDMLRAAHRTRVDYFGPWLPEPLVGNTGPEPDDTAELASSLSTAFLLLLERLTPAERAAYLLHDVFDYDYDAIGAVLDKKQGACRQLVSRARKHIGGMQARFTPEPEKQRHLLNEFLSAIRSGKVDRLESLLAEDSELWADGGGKVLAQPDIVHGPEKIARLLNMIWRVAWHRQEFIETKVNGGPGLILREDDTTAAILSLAVTPHNQIVGIYVVRNPDKLGRSSAEA
jgi:RNA polymerase sigma-70 factor (ECF subfamily)